MKSITSATRRAWLGRAPLLAAPSAAVLAGCTSPGPRAAPSARSPFTLGIASGFPTDRSVTLWTRLAPDPQAADGGMPARPVAVRWQLAADPAMRQPVAAGSATARPDQVHAVHVDVTGLAPDRPYWYRFEADGQQSPVGRTRTLPSPEARLAGRAPLRIAVASCQNIEHGYYAAWRHLVADDPDLVLHLGDYIYETTWGRDLVRPHGLPTARTLADYRARYTLYRRDPDLQAAHAAAPWFVIQDDHEVANDYAGLSPERAAEQPTFAARRAAAWQAWYEHMPVPARLAPTGNRLPTPEAVRFGDLLTIHLLDTRQFRSPQACPPPARGGGGTSVVPSACAELADPRRTMLGAAQEARLDEAFARSASRWNLIAQQTLVSPRWHPRSGPGAETISTDGWDGYPAARERLIRSIQARRLANPVIVSGDLHAHYASDLRVGPRGEGAIVAAEFLGTSITSQGQAATYYTRLLGANPHLHFADGSRRGYLRLTLAAGQMAVESRVLDDVRRADSGIRTQVAWAVEPGRPGLQRA